MSLDRARRFLFAALLSVGFATPASAQLTRLVRHEGPIGYVTVASSLRAASNNSNACSLLPSSTANLSGIPSGSTVIGAYLYWAGSGSLDNTVTFRGSTVTAASSWTDSYSQNGNTYSFFGARADVTPMITANGNSTLSNLSVNSNSTYCDAEAVLAGWSLIVVYRSTALPLRRVEIYDGFDLIRSTGATINVSGFLSFSASAPSPDAQISILTWEGDATLSTGEQILFNGVAQNDASNPVGDVFNSSSGFGVDLDTYDVSSDIGLGARSATIRYETGTDLLAVQSIVSSISIAVVDVTPKGVPALTDRNAGTSYFETFNVENTSIAADNFDLILTRTGSPLFLQRDSITGTGLAVRALSDSLRVAIPAQTTNTYRVWYTVPAGTPANNTFSLKARSVTYPTRVEATATGFLDIHRLSNLVPDLVVSKTASPGFAEGSNSTYTLTVRNTGVAATAGNVVVRDSLPTGLTFVASAAVRGTWTFTNSGRIVTGTRASSLAVGDSAIFTITVSVAGTAAPSATNTAVVSGGGETNLANDTARIATPVQALPNYSLTKTTAGSFIYGTQGVYNFTVSNTGFGPGTVPLVVVDTLPTDISFVTGSGTGWSFSSTVLGNGLNVVTATYGGAPLGATNGTTSFSITADVTNSTSGSVMNRAWVSGGPESSTANNSASTTTAITPRADLAIAKTAPANFAQGLNDSYTITISNVGNATTSGTITVRDTLPVGMTYVSATGAGWSISGTGNVMVATRSSTISAGASATFTITVSPQAAAVPSVTNKAVVSGGNQTILSNDTAFVTTPVSGVVDLSITKTAPAFTQFANSAYTVTVSNIGSNPSVSAITVTDTLPANVAFTSAAGTGWTFTNSGQVLVATYAAILAGGSTAPFTINVSVGAAAATITNRAHLSGGSDGSPANNTGTAVTAVAPRVDLIITKTSSAPFTYLSNSETYSLVARNIGGTATTGAITIVDTLPAGITYVSRSGNNWTVSYNAGTRVVTATSNTTIAAGANAQTLVLTVSVAAAAYPSVINTAWVGGGNDFNNTNNSDTDSTTVSAPDVTISKTSPASFTVGSSGTYTITISNIGTASTNGNITVRDTAPAGLTFTNMSGANWSIGANGVTGDGRVYGDIVYTGTLAPGASSVAQLIFDLDVEAAPTVTNTVYASGGNDVNMANNGSSVTTPVNGADLQITKTAPALFTVGGTGVYTISVRNVGATASSGTVTVRDTLPGGVTYVTSANVRGTWNRSQSGGVVTATYTSNIASNDSVVFTITTTINAAARPSVSNKAYLSGGNQYNAVNDTSRLVTAVATPDMTVAKVANGTFQQSANATYTITTTNSGTGPTTVNTVVSDTLPSGLTYVSAAGTGWAFVNTAGRITATYSGAAIPAGGTAAFTLTVSVGAAALPSVTNRAWVSGGGEINTANNGSGNVVTAINGLADLTVTKVAGAANFTQGTNATYTITVNNPGTGASSGIITVTDTLAPGLTFVSGNGAGWTIAAAGQVVTATTSNAIAPAGSSPLTITVSVGAAATPSVTNIARVSGGADSNTANNTSAVVTTPVGGAVDLTVSKVAVGVFQQSYNASYTITVTNSGTATSTGVITVVDTLANGLTFVSGTGSGWTVGISGQVVTATRSTAMPAAATAPFNITVIVGANALPSVANRAWVAGGGDANTANNGSGTVTTAVGGRPGVSIVITVAPGGTVLPGGVLTWNTSIFNAGTASAVEVVIANDIPPETQYQLGSIVTTMPPGVATIIEFEKAGVLYTPVSAGCGAPAGYDGCVTKVRWKLQSPLAVNAGGDVWVAGRVK